MTKLSFNHSNGTFFKILKTKVNNYFSENNIEVTGNRTLYIKSIILILSAVTIYTTLVFYTPNAFISILLCGVLGVNIATIGFNIMHEGGHQSFSKYKWLNTVSAYSLNALGGTIYFWKQKHNINHHTYTNIDGMDFDIDIKFMRVHTEQPKYWFHRYQHLYWVLLYGISYLAWIFYQDFEKYFSRKMGAKASLINMPLKEHIIFWLTKIWYVTIYIVLPIVMIGWLKALFGLLIIAIISGLTLSIVFQMAHVLDETHFPEVDKDDPKIDREWAVHQLSTTANFATGSKFLRWLLGGLNFQVEHHLFPRISHIHYPKINQLVKETCLEYKVTYLEHPSWGKAFRSHISYIKKLGCIT